MRGTVLPEHIADETEPTEGRASSCGVLVSLHQEVLPFPDGGPTIRCCCARGCRRRCPLGRRLPCASCSALVGPCCGLRPVPAPFPGDTKTSHAVVCHACLGGGPADRCRWEPDPGDFRPMSAEERFRWKRCSEQLEAHRAELIWEDLDAEVRQKKVETRGLVGAVSAYNRGVLGPTWDCPEAVLGRPGTVLGHHMRVSSVGTSVSSVAGKVLQSSLLSTLHPICCRL